jgi:cytochrome c biogenesis protein CcmG/thiol:disulfide interchange protein DsbE
MLPDSDLPNPEGRSVLRRLPLVAALLAGSVLVGLLAYGVIARNPNTSIDDNLAKAQAAPAPGYRLQTLRRGTLGPTLTTKLTPALADGWVADRELRGTPYVLNVWASWCEPCREEAPLLQRAWREQGRPQGVLFVGLDMQDVRQDARSFMDDFGVDYLNIRDPSNTVPRRYGVTGVPETFFITAQGRVVDHVIGVVTPAQLRGGMAAARSGVPRGAQQGGARRPTRSRP